MIEFNKKSINIKTLGERLRDIREKAGISIEEVAKVTKINKKYLEYIEDDNYEKLPFDVYVKGFLRSYSNFLGIESKDVLRIYKKERGAQINIKKPRAQGNKSKKIKIPTIVLSFKLIVGVLSALFFISIAWYFYKETGKFAEVPRLLIFKPMNNSVIQGSSTEIMGVTDVGNKIMVNGQSIFVNEKGEFRERISLKSGVNKLKIESSNKFGKRVEKEINLSAQYPEDLVGAEQDIKNDIKEDKDGGIDIFVKTEEVPVWVSIKVDGVKQYSGTMLSDTEQHFEGAHEILVTSGMANKTFIKIGKEKEFHKLAEETGVIRDVVFRNKNSKKTENFSEEDRENKK